MPTPEPEIDTPLSPQDAQEIRKLLEQEIATRPPTIGLIGVSGTGKSSTINTLFKTGLPVSATIACTKEFVSTDVALAVNRAEVKDVVVPLRVIDAPGLGEDINLDPKYLALYRENLPSCDVILWVVSARNRAVALDQQYLTQLSEFADRIVFGCNQVDLVEPLDWDRMINLPSEEQLKNIDEITRDRKAKLEATLGRPITFIPYSAKTRYNLQELFSALLDAAPKHRSWLFSGLKAFRFDDFVPEAARRALEREQRGLFGYLLSLLASLFHKLTGGTQC